MTARGRNSRYNNSLRNPKKQRERYGYGTGPGNGIGERNRTRDERMRLGTGRDGTTRRAGKRDRRERTGNRYVRGDGRRALTHNQKRVRAAQQDVGRHGRRRARRALHLCARHVGTWRTRGMIAHMTIMVDIIDTMLTTPRTQHRVRKRGKRAGGTHNGWRLEMPKREARMPVMKGRTAEPAWPTPAM